MNPTTTASAIATHGNTTYQASTTDDGLTSYKPIERTAGYQIPAPPVDVNATQADGLACTICGSETNPMKPIGTHLGVQLFMCISHDNPPVDDAKVMAFWQTKPCPAWCTDHHGDSDEESDRTHSSAWTKMQATSMDMEDFGSGSGKRSWVAHTAEVALWQGYREVEPRLLFHDAANDRYHLYLTLDEAQEFACNMLEMVASARLDAMGELPFNVAQLGKGATA